MGEVIERESFSDLRLRMRKKAGNSLSSRAAIVTDLEYAGRIRQKEYLQD